ncbi:MAG: RNA polymerase sigma factor [Candidatus Limnocylindria bacterium]
MEEIEIAWRADLLSADWAALYAEHAAPLVGFLSKLTGDREVASELMQETFVRAIRGGERTDIRSARAWLFRIAANLARDHHRRRRLLRFVPFSGREPDPSSLHDPDAELVHRALRALPAAQSTTLLLHYDSGFSRREIAQMEGISEEAVKSRLARGRESFVRAFERIGGDLS